MILMVHDENTDASIAIAEGIVGGEHAPSRSYKQEGKYLAVEGAPHVLVHDVEQLQQLGYRMATPAEQGAFTRLQKQSTSINEVAEGDDVEVKEERDAKPAY